MFSESVRPKHKVLVALIFLFMFLGWLLSLNFYDQFFPTYSVSEFFFVVAIPGGWYLLAFIDKTQPMKDAFPNAWVRWFAWPLFVLTFAGLLWFSAAGWVAATSSWLAVTPDRVQVMVLHNGPSNGRKHCSELLTLSYLGAEHSLCADYMGLTARAVQARPLELHGLRSPIGFHVQRLSQ
jgi:hypothetical protein